ncbi:MAG: aminotransferase class III-fold pyridoxal phosphate-dependent enzyme, partial [Arenimonas sp.]
MSNNADLQQRRVDAVARGVGNATQLFAVRAENAEIWDADGKRYIDFAGGIGVMNTGHRHPKVMARIQKQLEGVVHSCFQVMPYEPYIELAAHLN